MYQGDCARCGRKVWSEANYLKAHLWTSTAVFHWSCFLVLMNEQGRGRQRMRPSRRSCYAKLTKKYSGPGLPSPTRSAKEKRICR